MALVLDQIGEFFPPSLPATWDLQIVYAAVAAALLSAALTALLVKIAPARGWVVIPSQNRWNQRVVAQFGGVPVILVTACVLLVLPSARQLLTLLLLTAAIGVLGLIDDIVGLGPKPKLIVQILLAGLAVHFGVVHALTNTPSLNALFTVIWIVGITNAFNLIDNIDGLAAGIGVIALLQIVLLGGLQAPVAVFAMCLLASLTGFLLFNVHPAKVFMGDVGSLPVGFFLACASVLAPSHLRSLGSVLLLPCLVLFIPIFDMLLVSVTRRLNGRAISRGARDHASHRLVLLGLSEPQAVSILYVVAFAAGVLAFCWEKFWPAWGAGFLSLFLIAATLFWLYLAKLELPESWLSQSSVLIISVPAFFLQTLARLCVLVLDAVIIILGLYFACLSNLQNAGRPLLAQFWIAAAFSVVIKLSLLIASGAYNSKWSLSRANETYPVLKGVFSAACVVTVGWVILSGSFAVPLLLILVDAVFTSALLLLTRASMQFFDYAIGKARLLSTARHSSLRQEQEGLSAPELRGTPPETRDSPDKWEM
jgi:UDP-GlcNAc:undecaprenyl-phosphate/decaprenyl-phosphate GlcNAc-1-phosphate transferase